MSFDPVFEKAISFTLKYEGGYVNNPNDPGGETKYGISKRKYPDLDIKNLSIEQAKEIYYNDYWIKPNIYRISKINPKLAIAVFDTHVNTGRGVKLLQKTIHQYPDKHFKQISIDNIYGNQTESLLSELNHISPNYLLYNYIINRIQYYNKITQKNKSLKSFLNGWLNRTIALRDYVLNLTF